jgi:hypothetical protein
MYGHIGQFLV